VDHQKRDGLEHKIERELVLQATTRDLSPTVTLSSAFVSPTSGSGSIRQGDTYQLQATNDDANNNHNNNRYFQSHQKMIENSL
jgi:hypothetical protein